MTLNGLLIVGALRVSNLRALRLVHCTLVPDRPDVPSLVVESGATTVTIERCILGSIRAHVDAEVTLTDSVCDAGVEGVAYASDADDALGGGRLTLEACTVLGKIHARVFALVSNTILLATVTAADDPDEWPGPVLADRRQEGCVRFSYLPEGSRTPQRYRCQPAAEADAARVRPVLSSDRYPRPRVRPARSAHAGRDLARRRRRVRDGRPAPPLPTPAPGLPRGADRRLPAIRPRGRILLRLMTSWGGPP